MQPIYERIETLIHRRGMTKKAFCEQLSISTGNLGDWKRGKSKPGTSKLIEIAAFFDVSLDWLVLGKGTLENHSESFLANIYGQKRELSKDEQWFIREYIEFVSYRHDKGKSES
ncbi:helix-turn-helix domain-containing protein [Paenibacillus sp. P96]|uniref:Helix-turn-helix domain-containing protein n=1 Tax=Paenibacillus zeirhizosphaerae TaxID=2987519 RepID=A0ABT9FVZ5_9BACL|nr:helix-turn-helix transcriptional regulator [Paenibacillus sp. P96]MDP4098882.1 helix-turn-helix domain-containing protein [Paenibacillus sp. P96]